MNTKDLIKGNLYYISFNNVDSADNTMIVYLGFRERKYRYELSHILGDYTFYNIKYNKIEYCSEHGINTVVYEY